MVNNITLTHSSVNGGTSVILQNSRVGLSLKKSTKTPPIPGKYDITHTEYGGFENPKISISGFFDVEDIDSNEANQELLTEFLMLQSTTPITLSVPTGSSPIYLKGRPTGGYETDGNMTMSNSIKVSIETLDISLDSTSEKGIFWMYRMSLTETI